MLRAQSVPELSRRIRFVTDSRIDGFCQRMLGAWGLSLMEDFQVAMEHNSSAALGA